MQSQSFTLQGANFGYTGARIDDIQTNEATLVTGLFDHSGSTRPFAQLLAECGANVIKSLRHTPAESYLMYRHCLFSTDFREVHGFQPWMELNPDDYLKQPHMGGQTSLYASTKNVIDATVDYAKQLAKKYRFSNGIIYIASDGLNYLEYDPNPVTMEDVRKSLAAAVSSEILESLITILVGINPDPDVQKKLEEFKEKCGFTKYIPIEDATPEEFAKLMNFLSLSVSSQSQARGGGAPSQPPPWPGSGTAGPSLTF